MTNEEILRKAIEKAHGNGYKKEYSVMELVDEVTLSGDAEALSFCMIFSHLFAEAFFGNEDTCVLCGETGIESGETHTSNGDDYWANCAHCGAEWMSKIEFQEDGNYFPAYLYHLQQMVLEEDPIKYLKKFL